jgi:hypothetical protein
VLLDVPARKVQLPTATRQTHTQGHCGTGRTRKEAQAVVQQLGDALAPRAPLAVRVACDVAAPEDVDGALAHARRRRLADAQDERQVGMERGQVASQVARQHIQRLVLYLRALEPAADSRECACLRQLGTIPISTSHGERGVMCYVGSSHGI